VLDELVVVLFFFRQLGRERSGGGLLAAHAMLLRGERASWRIAAQQGPSWRVGLKKR
jgi:hypothetical protein